MGDLTCEQVRLLVGRQRGLEHLADPVARFVMMMPRAWVTFYPGDMTAGALWAFPKILQYAPTEGLEMLKVDFAFLAAQKRLWPELKTALEEAQRLANSRNLTKRGRRPKPSPSGQA
jgi:hypothetical protein